MSNFRVKSHYNHKIIEVKILEDLYFVFDSVSQSNTKMFVNLNDV